MSDFTTVSVIITNHNYGQYLKQCVDSVLTQTYPNIELIVYDDASTDEETIKVLAALVDDGVHVEIGTSRLGLAKAANNSIRLSSGELVMRLDADDWLHTHCIEIMVRGIQYAEVVYSDYLRFDGKYEHVVKQRYSNHPHGSCVLMRRELFDELGGYNETLEHQEDFDFFQRLRSSGKFLYYIDLPLWYYREHNEQMSRAHNAKMKTRQSISQEPKILTVIPARGNSKGVPRKNLYKLAGVPLVTRAIRMVKASGITTQMVVSTEDDEIAMVARDEGVKVIERPSTLANDKVSTIPVAIHAMAVMDDEGWKPDIVITIQPTCPYTPPGALAKAVKHLAVDSTTDSVVSIAEIRGTHPYRAYSARFNFKADDIADVQPLFPDKAEKYLQRQDRPVFYGFTGGFYVRRRPLLERWSKKGGSSLFGPGFALGNCSGVIVPPKAAIDIDDRLDIFLAETILEHWNDE